MLTARLRLSNAELLRRERLLASLPDSPGHVVWLRAPYGYGKSVLAAHWADELEAAGWRVLWTARVGKDIRPLLAEAAGLTPDAPWGLVHEYLWSEPTLLVIEDLDGSEKLGPLLRFNNGLILFASRSRLSEPELPRLQTQGLLHVLDADSLAFTLEESVELAAAFSWPDPENSWKATNGWPLPLHFALMTGQYPESGSLMLGIRGSVGQSAWQEALFLAAAGDLSRKSATDSTLELARAGFVQELYGQYRLHPFLAERLHAGDPEGVRSAVTSNAARLEPVRRAHAFERAGAEDALAELLADTSAQLFSQVPDQYLAWSERVAGAQELSRRTHACIALMALSRFEEAELELDALMSEPGLSVQLRSHLLGYAASSLADAGRKERALELLEIAVPLDDSLDDLSLLRLLHNRGLTYTLTRDYAKAMKVYDRLLRLAARLRTAEANQVYFLATANLSTLHWQQDGDSQAALELLEGLEDNLPLETIAPTSRAVRDYNRAFNLLHLNREQDALEAVLAARPHASAFVRLWVDVVAAYVRKDAGAFPRLLAEARKWEKMDAADRVGAVWLRILRRLGEHDEALKVEPLLTPGHHVNLELALLQHMTGRPRQAAALLHSMREVRLEEREFRLQWYSASWRIEKDEASLDALVALTAQPLPMIRNLLIPLDELPRHRPELARGFPLDEVLASGWEEAIALRLPEIEPLQLRLLGGMTVTVRGRRVELAFRQQQILLLLALGLNREEVAAELWSEADAERAANNLRVQYHLLRRALEPWGQQTFLADFRLIHTETDLDLLERALKDGATQAVLDLYRHPLAPAFDLPLVNSVRDSLQQRVCGFLLERSGEAGFVLAVACLERVLELEPLHEDALRELLTLLVAKGRRHVAQRRFDSYAERLGEETGLEPRAETRAPLDREP